MSIEEVGIQDALRDRFWFDREIGRGGMAVVYLANDLKHDRQVAIKVLRPDLIDTSHEERFLREVRLEGRLQHPNILPIFESGKAGRYLFYVMPFVEGETLSARLSRDGPLPVADALRFAREVAEALACAHASGVIHRDVKPANILLSGGHAMLADFGVARALADSAGDLTSSGIVLGTPTYMAPEQADTAARVDERSDIYSLGCVTYEMIAGEPPFTGRTSLAIFAKHYSEPVPSLEVVRPGIAPEVTAIVSKSLAKIPVDRFANAQSFIDALDTAETALTQPRVVVPDRITIKQVAVRVAAVAALAAGIWVGTSFIAPDDSLDPNKVVVYPLSTRNDRDPDSEVIDAVVGMALDHAEPLRWYAGWNWLSPDQRAQGARIPEQRRISEQLGARYFITGTLTKASGSIHVTLTLHDVQTDSTMQASASSPLGVSTAGPIALDAVRQLLPKLVDPQRAVDLSLISERAPAAIANWMQGERNYRLSRFADALAFYQRALDADSLMVFAALKGAQAANWSHQPEQANQLLQRALASKAALPARYQPFLEGLHAYLTGAPDTAIARLGNALRASENWSEASMLLGEVHHHLLPHRVSNDSAVAHFERSATDPGFTPPLIHLAEHAIREGRIGDAKKLIDRLETNGANAEAIGWLSTMLKCVDDGPDKVPFTELARTNKKLVYDVGMLLLPGAQQVDCSRAAFEAVLTTDAWTTEYSWPSAQALQGLLVAEGKVAEASALLNSAIQSAEQSQNPTVRRAAASALFVSVIDALAGAPMEELLKRVDQIARERYGAQLEQVRGVHTPWVLGNLYSFKNDTALVARLRNHLAVTAADTANAQRVNAGLRATAMDARLKVFQRDTPGAIAQLERLRSNATTDVVQEDLGASMAPERLLLARLYLERKQYKQAHDVAAAFDHRASALIYVPFIPASLQIRREAARAMNDRRAAEYTRRLQALGRDDLLDRAR